MRFFTTYPCIGQLILTICKDRNLSTTSPIGSRIIHISVQVGVLRGREEQGDFVFLNRPSRITPSRFVLLCEILAAHNSSNEMEVLII